MTELTPALQAWTVSAAVLSVNVLLLAFGNAAKRSAEQQCLNPEDLKLNADSQVIAHDTGVAARWGRAHRNALENIPLFLVTALAFALTSPSMAWMGGVLGAFTAARLAHSVAYVQELQPWRSVTYFVGALTQFVLLGALLFHALA